MSNVNVEINRKEGENSASVLRRFQKKVQESGILPRVRSLRYSERGLSDLKVKLGRLKKLGRQKEFEKLKRLGKVVDFKKKR